MFARSQIVVSVVPNEKGVDVICLDGNELRGIHCEKAIFASPMFTAPYVIRGFREDAPFAAGEFQHNAWFVANLFLKDRPKPRFTKDFPLCVGQCYLRKPGLGIRDSDSSKRYRLRTDDTYLLLSDVRRGERPDEACSITIGAIWRTCA